MAQKKLLLILVWLIAAFPRQLLANEQFKISDEDKAWAKELAARSVKITLSAIKEKYTELQKILGKRDHEHDEFGGVDEFELGVPDLNKPVLRVFVSFSMGRELLRQYVDDARKYGAVLVFNGLPEGSWLRLSDLVMSISDGEDNVAMQIDDEAFKRFDIKSVPSFVLSEEEGWEIEEGRKLAFDKVNGNIGIRAALEMFAGEGDMAEEAEAILKLDRIGSKGRSTGYREE